VPPLIAKVRVWEDPWLTTLTTFGDIMSALPPPGPSIVIAALVVPPTESRTFKVTVPAATFAGKLTVIGVPFHMPSPGALSKAFDGSVEVVT
jgi:hypothetical protein